MFRVWFNPNCSKCRQAKALLDERGVEYELYEYLSAPPSRDELESLLDKLGGGPQGIVRSKEAAFAELALANADDDTLLAALSTHPELIERPIVVSLDRAVVARPPTKLLGLLPRASTPSQEPSPSSASDDA